ncbi:acetaldehyde dehydrogenase (acetylating) [Peptoniphilus sp. AGMB00490]|uniref:Acetaldehyde dehydrogenase (Acetylating) n=2 Tax=Peptoniphilus TaxID=162289 RepID=A0ACD6AZQ0_9FIRM|nr:MULTISPECIES: acetaldehyde dehydrogenase (acetylating) [Peptoniphilus]NMW85317.1 acetaldehyde dehydrogenase (acetylating) [Peptoniphilus faecalis]OLR65264.1 acetaldehyde dehydrogenase (acetylating) [Peptoniphilus porci]
MSEFDFDLSSIQDARDLARKGLVAEEKLKNYTFEEIDKIIKAIAEAGEAHAKELAELAVEETGFGKVKDKIYKNHMASGLLYEQIKNEQTIGIIAADEKAQTLTVADPVGLIMGIVPSTNPTSTVLYNAMIAIKSRNPIIFSPHPKAAKCSLRTIEIVNDAAVNAGAPENIVQGLSKLSMEATNELMHSKEVKLIIATGGPGMVKAAYSAGKPAIGVGAGNSPAYIERSADVKKAVRNIMASKTFDNGTICASEQSIITETCNRDEVIRELKAQGAYFMNKEETDKVCKLLFKNGTSMNANYVGRSAKVIADAAHINVGPYTRVLVGEQFGVGPEFPLSYEKLTSVLGFYTVENWEEACDLSIELLQNGIGHTMSLHTEDKEIARKFSVKPASRILINTGGTMGGTGLSTGLPIALTLGCGTMGGSSVSENVGPKHLINIKKLVYGIKDAYTLVENDELFKKYHPEEFANYSTNNCELTFDNLAGLKNDKLPEYNSSKNYFEYSTGCNVCKDNKEDKRPSVTEEGLDLEALQKMLDELVHAFKGE